MNYWNPYFTVSLILSTIITILVLKKEGKFSSLISGIVSGLFIYFVSLMIISKETFQTISNEVVLKFFLLIWWTPSIILIEIITGYISSKVKKVVTNTKKTKKDTRNEVERKLDEIDDLFLRQKISEDEKNKMRNKVLGID